MATVFSLEHRGRPAPASSRFKWQNASRNILLVTAVFIVAALFVYPRILGTSIGPIEHWALLLVLLGVCGAFVQGVGFKPEFKLARLLLGPIAAWIFVILGVVLLILG
jgi:predicted membrane protein